MNNIESQPVLQTFKRISTECICGNLRKTTRVVTKIYDKFLQPSGLLITQFHLLGATAAYSPIAFSPLAKQLDLDPTTLARNLQPLAKAGLVVISPGQDRRTRMVQITRLGWKALDTALPLWGKAQSWVINQVGEDSWQNIQSEWIKFVSISMQK